MLYNLLISLVDQFSALNVFRYLTFRTGLSVMSSMLIVFLIGGPFIKFIETHKITGPIRDDGPLDHIVKKVGTPTMGGILILIGILFGTLLWADLKNSYIWVLLMVATSFGLLGAIDDYLKIKRNNSRGITSGMKIIFQIILSLISIFLTIVFIAMTTYLWIRNDELDNKVDQTLIFVVESIGSELTAAEGNMIQALSAQEDKETTIRLFDTTIKQIAEASRHMSFLSVSDISPLYTDDLIELSTATRMGAIELNRVAEIYGRTDSLTMRENELLEGLLELIMSVKIALVSKIEMGTTEIKFDKSLVEEAVNVSKDFQNKL